MIDCSNAVTQPDSLNLQDERSTIVGGPHIEEGGETMKSLLYYFNCSWPYFA